MLNFEDFLFVLRGRPNEERQAVIDYVYGIFDKENTGVADANEMKKVFNCQKHPKFNQECDLDGPLSWVGLSPHDRPFHQRQQTCR